MSFDSFFSKSRTAGTNTDHSYDDIINLVHHVSVSHPHMSRMDRAAQFSPFAALTGHREAVSETRRLTSEKPELDENMKQILDGKLQILLEQTEHPATVSITYFIPDQTKTGGSFATVFGTVKKADVLNRTLLMQDGLHIPIDDITDIKSDSFHFTESTQL